MTWNDKKISFFSHFQLTWNKFQRKIWEIWVQLIEIVWVSYKFRTYPVSLNRFILNLIRLSRLAFHHSLEWSNWKKFNICSRKHFQFRCEMNAITLVSMHWNCFLFEQWHICNLMQIKCNAFPLKNR